MRKPPEEIFYEAQQSLSEYSEPTAETLRMFEAGGRYAVVADSLRHEPMKWRGTIAELGCGNGDKLIYAKDAFDFASGAGIDLCFEKKIVSSDGGCKFYTANLNNAWPLENEGVDVLIAMMLLEHLFDPFECFREIKRVLSPSGRAFVNLPLVTSVKNRLRLLFGRIPVTSVPYLRWQPEGHWDGFHLHYFNLSSIYDLAASSGLKISRLSSVGRLSKVKNVLPGCFVMKSALSSGMNTFEDMHVH